MIAGVGVGVNLGCSCDEGGHVLEEARDVGGNIEERDLGVLATGNMSVVPAEIGVVVSVVV
jgi:hypothetical protein